MEGFIWEGEGNFADRESVVGDAFAVGNESGSAENRDLGWDAAKSLVGTSVVELSKNHVRAFVFD
jgi:hypothetical protein